MMPVPLNAIIDRTALEELCRRYRVTRFELFG